MQRLLIDHARKRAAARRGAGWQRETLSNEHETCQSVLTSQENLLLVNQALDRLAAVDQRGARVVALRVFAGLTVVEVAETLGISPRTVSRGDRAARRSGPVQLPPGLGCSAHEDRRAASCSHAPRKIGGD
jgi:RNA polymerase sigma factor (sigma-70 family)